MRFRTILMAGVMATGVATAAFAQSASTAGSAGASSGPSGSAATGGSAGSAAAGGTSASTLGTAGTSTSPNGTTASSIGSAGSAAGGDKNKSSTKLGGNDNNLHGMSKARAQDQGTWSDSKTKTKVHKGEVTSRTKSMAHQPGGPPAKSTTTVGSGR